MSVLIKIIGSIIFGLLMYAIPVLLVCSVVYGWDGFVQLVLYIFAFGELGALCTLIYSASEVK